MVDSVPVATAQQTLRELVDRARYGRERVMLSEHGEPVVAIVSVGELEELQAARDMADIHGALAAKSAGGRWIRHEEVLELLAADEAASSAA